jgi:hypothetical protein
VFTYDLEFLYDLRDIGPLKSFVYILGQSEQLGRVRFIHLVDHLHVVLVEFILGQHKPADNLLLVAQDFRVEIVVQIGQQDPQIRFIVHSASVNRILENAVQGLPVHPLILNHLVDDLSPRLQIRIGELVELGPALGDVGPSFLHHRLEQTNQIQQLAPLHRPLLKELRSP